MGISPSSSAQQARQRIAQRLREIRLDAGLSARAIAKEAGWHESKSSRIEHARMVPSAGDIRAWCRACGVEDQAADLIAASRTADSMYVEWERLQKSGLRRLQESKVPLYEGTRHFRVYCSNVIPGLFQTRDYAGALLSSISTFRGVPNDVEDAVAARVARSRVLHQGDHRFAVLMEEWVLRCRVGDAEVMAGQLRHLLTVMSLPSVSLGVIPFTAPRRMWPVEAYNIFDETLVQVELLSAAVNVTQPDEVSQYVRGFAELAGIAVYGAGARSLIAAAIKELD
ncbi:helix-turn-helix domain-containing protein [Streptosporangium sp. NPDC002721]|uniref:helix-turn-helix domain-containing protein n=1 Tax=Streptosporangium sp. NPDC002721 TaxID=3366188 RepID=UPI00369D1431